MGIVHRPLEPVSVLFLRCLTGWMLLRSPCRCRRGMTLRTRACHVSVHHSGLCTTHGFCCREGRGWMPPQKPHPAPCCSPTLTSCGAGGGPSGPGGQGNQTL